MASEPRSVGSSFYHDDVTITMSTTDYIDVQRSLHNLKPDVHPDNYQAIRKFIDHQAAEGISETQQSRQISSFKAILTNCAPDGFRLPGATEAELKELLARLNRSDYAEASKHKHRSTIKKFYKVENGGREHPEKVQFFTVTRKKPTTVTREDLFTDDELTRLYQAFSMTRDRAFTKVMYETAARPEEMLSRNIGDFLANEQGDFLSLEGIKNTPDRTNQLIRAGRTVREWLSEHPLGGELGSIDDPSVPLWVKTGNQDCIHCGELPRHHDADHEHEPDHGDRMTYSTYYKQFKDACENAGIPANKRQPYKLRHTRLTEVATFMGYEQLNKFAGWEPGSDRAKIYVHLNNDDVNQTIRDHYGLTTDETETEASICAICGTENQHGHTECRTCGRPLSLEDGVDQSSKLEKLERLVELEERGLLDKLEKLNELDSL